MNLSTAVGFSLAILATCLLTPASSGQGVTQIIDSTGDGIGHGFVGGAGIAVHSSGNVYVAGRVSNNAFEITPGGTITQIIDASGDGLGNSLIGPRDVQVHASGNVYVSGGGSHNVFRITPGGVITQIIGPSGDGMGNVLYSPYYIAVDAAENVYVSGWASENAFKVTPGGVVTEIIDNLAAGGGTPQDRLKEPTGIAVDRSGTVYLACQKRNNLWKIEPDGTISKFYDGPSHPKELAIGADDYLYVCAQYSDAVVRFAPDASYDWVMTWVGDGEGNYLDAPVSVAVNSLGYLAVAGWGSENVFRVTPDGVAEEVLDAAGDGLGSVYHSTGYTAIDEAGSVYASGSHSDNAFRIDGSPVGMAFCTGGAGVGTPCPCGNDNDGTLPDSGCANGVYLSGAKLTGRGSTSVTADNLVLSTIGQEPNNTGLYFQGEERVAGGGGVWFGDGLRCAGGDVVRLEVVFADASGLSRTSVSLSSKGGVSAGDTKRYQCWYRTVVTPPCGSGVNDFNLSNGFEVLWTP